MHLGLKLAALTAAAGATGFILAWPQAGLGLSEADSAPPPSIGAEGVNFVAFQTSWCGACKMLAPTWNELSRSTDAEKCRITSVDCDIEKDTCKRYGIKRYPTLLLFHEGEVVTEYRGRRTLRDFKNFLRNFENVPTAEKQ